MNGRIDVWWGPYAYRCEKCGETSPEVFSRRELDTVRYEHRMTAHGGFIPDGETVLQPERMSLGDLPREQRVIGSILLAVIVLSALAKIM